MSCGSRDRRLRTPGRVPNHVRRTGEYKMGWLDKLLPSKTDDESYLRSAPLPPARRRLLWMDPGTLGLLVNAQVLIQEGNQLITTEYPKEDLEWAKQVNVSAVKAEQAGRAGRDAEAIAFYKEALTLAPGCDLYLMSVGCCYANLGELQRGLKYLERAHEISPGEERITRNFFGVRQAAVRARTGLDGRG